MCVRPHQLLWPLGWQCISTIFNQSTHRGKGERRDTIRRVWGTITQRYFFQYTITLKFQVFSKNYLRITPEYLKIIEFLGNYWITRFVLQLEYAMLQSEEHRLKTRVVACNSKGRQRFSFPTLNSKSWCFSFLIHPISIHLYNCIRLSLCLFIHPCVYLLTYLFIQPANPCTYGPSIHPSIYDSVYLST